MNQNDYSDQNELINKYLNLKSTNVNNIVQEFQSQCEIKYEKIKPETILLVDKLDGTIPTDLILKESIIGVDIEHTNKVGFDGKICLIQLKTSTNIFLFDTIGLEGQVQFRNLLVDIFENENIKKIFYASSQDLMWLQRDFQIQVKNYADIKVILEQINIKNKGQDNSLIGLWKKYCQHEFTKDQKKKMQLADWFIRPIPQQQLEYSALDCHYLPYIWYKLIMEQFQNYEEEDLIKILKKFNKVKLYEREAQTRYYFFKIAQNKLPEILEDFADHYDNDYYDELSLNEMTLIKFIFTELCLARQEYAMVHNQPPFSIDDDENLLKTSVILFEKLKLSNLKDFNQFSPELWQYTNPIYLSSKERNKDLTYIQLKNKITNGFLNALQLDETFVNWALTEMYNTEQFKSQQQEFEKKKQEIKHQRTLEKNTMNRPIFGDCKMLAPDNLVLCNCDAKKANWYLKNDKAELVSEDPFIIRLKFQPSGFKVTKIVDGQEVTETQFITTERINQCTVCGAKQNLLKYNIVPPAYKSYFPHDFKILKTHGFVLLCIRCHEKASQTVDVLKEQISMDFNVPLKVFSDDVIILRKILNLQKQTNNFKNKSTQYPKEVKKNFKGNLRSLLLELTQEQSIRTVLDQAQLPLNKKGNIRIKQEFFYFVSSLDKNAQINQDNTKDKNIHGQLVVEKLKTDQDYHDFIGRWRGHFIEQLKPQYLPDSWYIDGKPKSEQQVFFNDTMNKQTNQEHQIQ